ncbi:MAG: apolipoprotein N-acyltransferase [Candidatus Omnitrophica bacterium]|nr:apolipoprotein N-acyltransferase [Candidatus Omnitrophota bacterium]
MSFVLRIFLAVLSALLLSLAFSSYNLDFLAWVGLVPLFFALQGQGAKEACRLSYLCGLIFFLSSMYWLVYVTPSGWILLSLYQALYFGIFGLLCSKLFTIHHSLFTSYFSIPAFWCLLEYLRSHIFGGIGWNLLAYSQYKNTPLIQIADITGAYGVSFFIVLVNLAIFLVIKMAIRCQKTHKRLFAKADLPFKEEIKINPLFQTLAVMILVACVLGYGHSRICNTVIAKSMATRQPQHGTSLKISVIQGNIPQTQKWDPDKKYPIMKRYSRLTLEAAKDEPDLIIWPETSVPGYAHKEKDVGLWLSSLAKKAEASLLVGAPASAGEEYDYNSAILFSKKGEFLKQYNKLHLVMFGEYIPFEKHHPQLRKYLPLTGNFTPGNDYTIFQLPAPSSQLPTKFGVLICFEDIFPGLVRRFVKEGADFMVNITNDAWFGKTAAAYQHAANSVFRAVENRRPFIRSANTGLSCFIDSLGRVYARVSDGGSDLFIEGYKSNTIKLYNRQLSFYTKYGDIFILLCLFITTLFIIDYISRRRYNKKLRRV